MSRRAVTYLMGSVLAVRLLLTGGFAQVPYVPEIYKAFVRDKNTGLLADFSYAGYHYGTKALPDINTAIVDVSRHSVRAGVEEDQTSAVQRIIDSLGKAGGGVVYFPKGTYYFNIDSLHQRFITINYSRIVLRGAGEGENGTVFINGNHLLQPEGSYSLSPFLIQTGYALQGTKSFWGIDYPDTVQRITPKELTPQINKTIYPATVIAQVTSDAARGAYTLKLNSTKDIKARDAILVGMFNTTDSSNLMQALIQPYQQFHPYQTAALLAGKNRSPSYQWLVEVDTVLDAHTIRLMQPLRHEVSLLYNPVIAKAPLLTEIGVEHIRFSSRWDGAYCHHGCNKADKREGQLMDYGWNAINFCRVKHSWIKNVVILNYTNPIYLLDSRNVTVSDITIGGYNGHSGIKIYSHASDNLVKNISFTANYTHVISGEGNAYGNVFSGITYAAADGRPGDFDFHGFANARFAPPGENLFENVTGMCRISGGGSAFMLPHAGNRNVWWNVEGDGLAHDREVFTSWVWESKSVTLHPERDHHKMYPGSILIGFSSARSKLTIDGNTGDIKDRWMYTEQFNGSRVWPSSLYQQQLKLRTDAKKDLQ